MKAAAMMVASSSSVGQIVPGLSFGMASNLQLQPKRLDDFQDSSEAWISLSGQSFVKAFPAKPGIPCKLTHAARACNVSKRFGDKSGIVASLFQASIEVKRYVFLGFKVFGAIPAPQFDFIHCFNEE